MRLPERIPLIPVSLLWTLQCWRLLPVKCICESTATIACFATGCLSTSMPDLNFFGRGFAASALLFDELSRTEHERLTPSTARGRTFIANRSLVVLPFHVALAPATSFVTAGWKVCLWSFSQLFGDFLRLRVFVLSEDRLGLFLCVRSWNFLSWERLSRWQVSIWPRWDCRSQCHLASVVLVWRFVPRTRSPWLDWCIVGFFGADLSALAATLASDDLSISIGFCLSTLACWKLTLGPLKIASCPLVAPDSWFARSWMRSRELFRQMAKLLGLSFAARIREKSPLLGWFLLWIRGGKCRNYCMAVLQSQRLERDQTPLAKLRRAVESSASFVFWGSPAFRGLLECGLISFEAQAYTETLLERTWARTWAFQFGENIHFPRTEWALVPLLENLPERAWKLSLEENECPQLSSPISSWCEFLRKVVDTESHTNTVENRRKRIEFESILDSTALFWLTLTRSWRNATESIGHRNCRTRNFWSRRKESRNFPFVFLCVGIESFRQIPSKKLS